MIIKTRHRNIFMEGKYKRSLIFQMSVKQQV